MPSNILVTGAAGYIGGSIVADFLASNNALLKQQHIVAAVRSDEQAEALSKLGIDVIQLDLKDEKAVLESLLRHEISIVIQTASSIDASMSLALIDALSMRKEATGEDTYYIHTSAGSAFYPNTGWPPEEIKDTDAVFDIEKRLANSFPVRKTDVAVVEHAKARGVTTFIVVPCQVYGKGTGEWNKLSVVLPVYVKASIEHKAVFRFRENTKRASVHITDLTALYALLVEKILSKHPIESGTKGYYFALAHDIYAQDLAERLGAALHARGLVADEEPRIWESDEEAAEALGVPVQFVVPLWNSGENVISDNEGRLGWKPKWDKDRFFDNIDDEIDNVLELGKAKSSLIDSLFKASKG